MNENESKREFEVGVRGIDGDYEHITVGVEKPSEAYKKAEKKACGVFYDLEEPVNAYQAFELGTGVIHEP